MNETQKEVVKLQTIMKGITATIFGGTWMASDSEHAIWVALGGAVADTLLKCLWFEEAKSEEN